MLRSAYGSCLSSLRLLNESKQSTVRRHTRRERVTCTTTPATHTHTAPPAPPAPARPPVHVLPLSLTSLLVFCSRSCLCGRRCRGGRCSRSPSPSLLLSPQNRTGSCSGTRKEKCPTRPGSRRHLRRGCRLGRGGSGPGRPTRTRSVPRTCTTTSPRVRAVLECSGNARPRRTRVVHAVAFLSAIYQCS